MSKRQEFTMTKHHLMLLANMNVWWWDIENGAPCIDPKRPYGNSDMITDIANLLGFKRITVDNGEEYWPTGTRDFCEKIHRELETALQVALSTQSFETGDYVAAPYTDNWHPYNVSEETA